jgi:RIO-like serine/threonine protein kinase
MENTGDKNISTRMDAVKNRLNASIEKLHRASIFHHNLRQRNVIVDKNDIPRIIDFSDASNKPEDDWTRWHGTKSPHDDFYVLREFSFGKRQLWRSSNEDTKLVARVLDQINSAENK